MEIGDTIPGDTLDSLIAYEKNLRNYAAAVVVNKYNSPCYRSHITEEQYRERAGLLLVRADQVAELIRNKGSNT